MCTREVGGPNRFLCFFLREVSGIYRQLIFLNRRQLIWRNIGSEPRLRLRFTRNAAAVPLGHEDRRVTCPYHVVVCKDAPLVDLRQCPGGATPRSVHQSPTSTTVWECISKLLQILLNQSSSFPGPRLRFSPCQNVRVSKSEDVSLSRKVCFVLANEI